MTSPSRVWDNPHRASCARLRGSDRSSKGRVPLWQWRGEREPTASVRGIGVQLQANPICIRTTFPNSPAEAAGLWAGDEIIATDGRASARLTIPETMPLLRGEEGTQRVPDHRK
jgi:hypothetical protein